MMKLNIVPVLFVACIAIAGFVSAAPIVPLSDVDNVALQGSTLFKYAHSGIIRLHLKFLTISQMLPMSLHRTKHPSLRPLLS